MEAARDAGTRRVVSQSGAYMFEPTPETADESSPVYVDAPDPVGFHIRSSVAGEDAVVGTSGVEGLVLRYGFFYGPGTAIGSGGEWSDAVQSGELPIVGEGGGVYPFIHVDDAVSATLRAIDNGAPGIYNVVCDEPAPQREWISYLAELLGAPTPPELDEDEAADKLGVQSVYYGARLPRVSNAKAKEHLGMELRYASWRDGFDELFGKRE
jgi:2-alkyl-3-oxoalkanoate reductase